MHVSTEVRRREPLERPTDPTTYAAVTGAGNFLAMLTEVTRPPEKRELETTPSEGPPEASNADTDSARDAENTAAHSTSVDESNPAGEATTKSTTENVDKPVGNATGSPAATENPATPETANGVPAPKAVAATPTPVATTSTAGQSVETDPPLLTDGLAPESEGAVAKLTESAAARAAKAGGNTAEVTVEPDSPTPPPATFPKTLNALIAEEAVRQVPDTEGTAPPGTEANVLDSTELPADLDAGQPPLPEESQPVALPRSAALETAGIRPEPSGAPRVPLANLPGNLAQQINLMQQEGSRTMRIRLAPEHLGEIQIEIQGSGDALRVRLTSALPAVRDVLESQMADLKDALQKQGIALDQATVDGEPARRQAQEERNAPAAAPTAQRPTESHRATMPAVPVQSVAGSTALNLLV